MTNENLNAQLKQLSDFVVKSNKQIDLAETGINLSLEAILKNVDKENLKDIQSHVAKVKILLNKAKKGESVENEIKSFSKNIKNASKNFR